MKILKINRSHLGALALAIWIPAVVYPTTLFMASHLLTLPSPTDADKLETEMVALVNGKGWNAVHTLMGGCGCSKDVGTYLATRGKSPEYTSETILLVDADEGEAAPYQSAGFRTVLISGADLVKNFGMQAAPSLVIVNPNGKIAYSGGYYERSARVAVMDLKLLKRIKDGASVKALPLFGCGVGQSLQSAIDPLGLKYKRTEKAHVEPQHFSEVSDAAEGKDRQRAAARHAH